MEAKILKAISETMTCEKCPCACRARENSSLANCVEHWAEMLSKINPNADWKEIKDEVTELRFHDSDDDFFNLKKNFKS